MRAFRILFIALIVIIGCQGCNRPWAWAVEGLEKDHRTNDFGDVVSLKYNPKTNEWRFFSSYSIYGPYYYGIAQGVQVRKDGKNNTHGTYEFPGRFYIYLSETSPSSFHNYNNDVDWAELRCVDWVDDENVVITYLILGETKKLHLRGGIEKKK